MTKKIRTNKDFIGALFRGGVKNIKAPEHAPEQVKELLNHVKESTEEKFAEADDEAEDEEIKSTQEGTIETEGTEVN